MEKTITGLNIPKMTPDIINDTIILGQALKNIEKIMSKILNKENIYFHLNWRSQKGGNRFCIKDANDNILIPTFDSLSTGQLALFNMFATIIRYADYNDINKSIQLHNIKGVVVIDEVELHLHSNLQYEILPELIKLLPQVQFIVTSHSPLFVLGMEKTFGVDGYELYEMPNGQKITAERYTQFTKAYKYLTDTQTFNTDILEKIKDTRSKPLIVTEGKTDWKHLKFALSKLKELEDCNADIKNLDIEFLEYKDEEDLGGDSKILDICKGVCKIKRENPVIFIFDNDNDKIKKEIGTESYKDFGNNVFAFLLPMPEYRKDQPISIEHLYPDKILKTPVKINDIERRLYFGNEFDDDGIGDNTFCKDRNKCGKDKIVVVDDNVFKLKQSNDKKVNLALSKNDFVSNIIDGKIDLGDFKFDTFIPVFDTINAISEKTKSDVAVPA
ncbi:MAG: ATP-binding protein [Oscillospiraceae bacterium]|nr:ATP-binding protein [Oscillospiraceae bacterium]